MHYMSCIILHTSCHAFHHVKACINFYTCSAYESEKVRVEQMLRRLVLINPQKGVIHQRCWRRTSINGAGVIHPWSGAKSDFCELTFSVTQASPGHTTTLLFDKCFITP
jgi:hypothetical protein